MVENDGGAGRFVRALDRRSVEAGWFWAAFDPDKRSDPRCIEVLFFAAPGNREQLWQRLELMPTAQDFDRCLHPALPRRRGRIREGVRPQDRFQFRAVGITCGVTLAFRGRQARMQAIIERCRGLDVHRETVVACLLIGAAGARARRQGRIFRTARRDLEALRDRLTAAEATHVGMESTGVWWRPVHGVLEGDVEPIVGNTRRIRNVPGRKSDVKDAERIASRLRAG